MSDQLNVEPQEMCIIPGCNRPVKTRGLCGACYQSARKLVRDKKTTWNRLAKMGLVNPYDGGSNPFNREFLKKMQQKEALREIART